MNNSTSLDQFNLSNATLATLQKQFGTLAPGKLQAQRKQFYSYVTYPLAGAAQINFFGQAVGNNGSTLEDTNIPVQGSFGTSHFLIKGVALKYKLPNINLTPFVGTDTTTLASEILGGLFGAGVFDLTVNAKTYLQVTRPFFQMPPADGRVSFFGSGCEDANTGAEPNVNLSSRSENRFLVDPEILILAQQNFSVTISYPAGQIPVRAAGIITAGNPLRVGVVLDGIEFRPVQ